MLLRLQLKHSTQAPVPITTSTPQLTATATSAAASPRPQYTINVLMDYTAKSLSADETILYPNHTGQTLNDLVIAVEPNYWQNCFTLESLTVNDAALTNYTLTDHKLSFQLPQALVPEAVIKISNRIYSQPAIDRADKSHRDPASHFWI